MAFALRKITDLKKLENSPRTISGKELQNLKDSIERSPDYFEARPIILSDRTGELVVIAGNQRLEACRILGIFEVPTYLLSGLDEEREREIIIRDNVTNGDWDFKELKNWAEALDIAGVDITFPDDKNLVSKGSEGEDIEDPEIKFTETLNEEHNYIVLFFDNTVDWLQAQTLFDLKPVQELSTRKDGMIKGSFKKFGISRIMSGADAINRIMGAKE